jgi:hypothetical protein
VRELALYLTAGIVYTALGIYNQNWLYSFVEGLAFLVFFVVFLPAVFKRLRR